MNNPLPVFDHPRLRVFDQGVPVFNHSHLPVFDHRNKGSNDCFNDPPYNLPCGQVAGRSRYRSTRGLPPPAPPAKHA
jgi:hypothetical protein